MGLRVLIVEDQKMMREGLRSLLENQLNTELVWEADNALDALKIIPEIKPDVIIMDVVKPFLNNIETTHRILSKYPDIKVIALSLYSDSQSVLEILRSGASGYLLKDYTFQELSDAIQAVIEGNTYFSPCILEIIVKECISSGIKSNSSVVSVLTSRQNEILKLLSDGKTPGEIAHMLSLSVKTIETCRGQLQKKLNVRGQAELTKYAIRAGLISLDN